PARLFSARISRDTPAGTAADDGLPAAATRDRTVRRADHVLDLPARAAPDARPRRRRAVPAVRGREHRCRLPRRCDRHRDRPAREGEPPIAWSNILFGLAAGLLAVTAGRRLGVLIGG